MSSNETPVCVFKPKNDCGNFRRINFEFKVRHLIRKTVGKNPLTSFFRFFSDQADEADVRRQFTTRLFVDEVGGWSGSADSDYADVNANDPKEYRAGPADETLLSSDT